MDFRAFCQLSEFDDVLSEEVLTLLEALPSLCDRTAAEVGQLSSGEIASAIAEQHPERARSSLKIATAILNRLKEHGYIQPAASPVMPTEITLKPEETVDRMSPRRLIEEILAGGEFKMDAWRRLTNSPNVVQASRRTTGLAWVVNEVLDVSRTLDYIELMTDPRTAIQTPNREAGERLLSLAEALGVETRGYLHPLDGSEVRGPDTFGYDWVKEISPELHKAALWALKTGNKAHPGFSYDAAQSLRRQDGVWTMLLSQHLTAIDQGDQIASSIQIYCLERAGQPVPPSSSSTFARPPLMVELNNINPRSLSPSGQRAYSQIEDDQQLWVATHNKLSRFRQALVIESGAAQRFQLEQDISKMEKELKEIEARIERLKPDLDPSSAPQTNITQINGSTGPVIFGGNNNRFDFRS